MYFDRQTGTYKEIPLASIISAIVAKEMTLATQAALDELSGKVQNLIETEVLEATKVELEALASTVNGINGTLTDLGSSVSVFKNETAMHLGTLDESVNGLNSAVDQVGGQVNEVSGRDCWFDDITVNLDAVAWLGRAVGYDADHNLVPVTASFTGQVYGVVTIVDAEREVPVARVVHTGCAPYDTGFEVGTVLYTDENGGLTPTIPSNGSVWRVGTVVQGGKILLDRRELIVLDGSIPAVGTVTFG
jgi:hypothetical protein